MTDIEVSTSYRWMSSDRPLSYTNWHPGQPSNLPGEDCGVLWKDFGFTWGDDYCNDSKELFICEKEYVIDKKDMV